MNILICEDNPQQRERMEQIVNSYIAADDNIALALSTASPGHILDYLKKNPDKHWLCFLDVDLQAEINGIELAVKIREIDAYVKIVFVTTHADLAYLVFTHKVEAMDYIVKDRPQEMEQRTIECIQVAYQRYLDSAAALQKVFRFEIGGRLWKIPHNDILFFETSPDTKNKAILYMKNEQISLRSPMSALEKLGPEFFRCHKSYIVNVNHIKHVDRTSGEIELQSGDIIPLAYKKLKGLLKAMER